jgi:hypothetical protein
VSERKIPSIYDRCKFKLQRCGEERYEHFSAGFDQEPNARFCGPSGNYKERLLPVFFQED